MLRNFKRFLHFFGFHWWSRWVSDKPDFVYGIKIQYQEKVCFLCDKIVRRKV